MESNSISKSNSFTLGVTKSNSLTDEEIHPKKDLTQNTNTGLPSFTFDPVLEENEDSILHLRVEDEKAIEGKYYFGKKLGQGAFGIVRLLKDKITSKLYACKSLEKKKKIAGVSSTSMYEQTQREISIMKKVRHTYIVNLYEVYETPKRIHLIMEYCSGGHLVDRIRERGNCSESDAKIIIQRLAESVAYLHSMGIVHRDLKPENVLLVDLPTKDPFHIKLSDFGLATFTESCTMMENVVGTPLYMAPEIIQKLGYSSQCDIWSIGVIMYLLICGYSEHSEIELHSQIVAGRVDYPERIWDKVSMEARSLCESLLKFDPAKRMTAKEILRHPWLTGEDMLTVSNTTVLDLMRTYNNEKRVRKVILTVIAAIRWTNLVKQSQLNSKPYIRTTNTPPTSTQSKKSNLSSSRHDNISNLGVTKRNNVEKLPQVVSRPHSAVLKHSTDGISQSALKEDTLVRSRGMMFKEEASGSGSKEKLPPPMKKIEVTRRTSLATESLAHSNGNSKAKSRSNSLIPSSSNHPDNVKPDNLRPNSAKGTNKKNIQLPPHLEPNSNSNLVAKSRVASGVIPQNDLGSSPSLIRNNETTTNLLTNRKLKNPANVTINSGDDGLKKNYTVTSKVNIAQSTSNSSNNKKNNANQIGGYKAATRKSSTKLNK
ncbi:Serine/threonine-protein kinase 33 [Nowakowskiella sp. JEL0407]|nr:Serine/threonine-protein kinase 33 [Nowakowskiella sp. JEL0407]